MKINLENNWKKSCYTIVEMMMVIAVFMIILSMAMAAWMNSGDQAKLRNAASEVNGMLNLARAKAVAELEPVRVVFDQHRNAVRVRLYYSTGNQLVRNVEPLYLPVGVRFITAPNNNAALSSHSASAATPNDIVFERTGRCSTGPSVPLRLITTPTSGNNVQSGQTYYDININLFTGRIKTIQREVD